MAVGSTGWFRNSRRSNFNAGVPFPLHHKVQDLTLISRHRQTWAADMAKTLSDCTAVFADPDNGVSRLGTISRKSATVDEVFALCEPDRLGLLIRFPHRLKMHAEQLTSYHKTFAALSTNSATARRIVSEPALGRPFSMTSDMLVRFQNRAN
jgi:hypothetical protein